MSVAKSTHRTSLSGDDYMAAAQAFDQASTRLAVLGNYIENKLPALGVGAEGSTVPIDGVLRVLSVGPGNGSMDIKILMKLHQREQRCIHAVIVEPNARMMERYKALVVKESEMIRGIDFEWRQETLEGFQKSQNGMEDKFHFIVSVSSIYYIDNKERYIQYMFDILEDDGVLMITIMSGTTPSSCWTAWMDLKHVESSQRQEPLINSCDLVKIFENLSIPVSETVHLKYSVNVTPCFASPLDNLPEEANRVLDFLSHMDDFTQNTPVEYQESFLEILGSEDRTERDASGQFLLGQDHVVFIIRGNGSTLRNVRI